MGQKRVTKKSPASTASEKLDSLLPLLAWKDRELHRQAAVLETAEMSQLLELAADPKIRRFLIARLSDNIALVDPGQAKSLEETLLAGGHTPKRVEGDCQ